MNKPKLPVFEMFTSIQGEGIYVGTPSIFLRVMGCNLHCAGCDTKYSWTGTDKLFTSNEVVKYVREKFGEGYQHLVITGGEPTLYAHYDGGLYSLVTRIRRILLNQICITIETNGSIEFPGIEMYNIGLWSISPKLQFMNKEYRKALLLYFSMIPGHVDIQLKFLVHDYSDMLSVKKFLEQKGMDWGDIIIILQPFWKPSEDYIKKTVKIVNMFNKNMDLFQGYDVRIIPQLHKFLWGNQRFR